MHTAYVRFAFLIMFMYVALCVYIVLIDIHGHLYGDIYVTNASQILSTFIKIKKREV